MWLKNKSIEFEILKTKKSELVDKNMRLKKSIRINQEIITIIFENHFSLILRYKSLNIDIVNLNEKANKTFWFIFFYPNFSIKAGFLLSNLLTGSELVLKRGLPACMPCFNLDILKMRDAKIFSKIFNIPRPAFASYFNFILLLFVMRVLANLWHLFDGI